jgi:hypothetical protein
MKGKLWLSLIMVALALVFAAPAYAFNWQHVGRAPLMTQGINDELQLQGAMEQYSAEVSQAMALGGVPGDPYMVAVQFKRAVREGRIQRGTFTRGQWMVYKPGGRITVVRDVVWSGQGPLEGFYVSVPLRGQELIFFVPRGCGNLALVEVRQAPIPPPQQVYQTPPQEMPPPPPVYYPQPQPYYQPTITPIATVSGGWCGGGGNYKINAPTTYISNVDARSVTQTDASYRAWNNGNTANSGNTRIQSNTQSWSNQQSWTGGTTTVQRQRGYTPTQPTTPPYCPPGQPAGRAGNYSQAALAGGGYGPQPANYGPTGTRPVLAGNAGGGYGPQPANYGPGGSNAGGGYGPQPVNYGPSGSNAGGGYGPQPANYGPGGSNAGGGYGPQPGRR